MKGSGDAPETRTLGVAFVLVPRFNMMTLTAAIEPMRVANYLSSEPLFEWGYRSAQGGEIVASNGMTIGAAPIEAAGDAFDIVVLCGSWGGPGPCSPSSRGPGWRAGAAGGRTAPDARSWTAPSGPDRLGNRGEDGRGRQARRNRAARPSATARPPRVGRSAEESHCTSPSSTSVAINRRFSPGRSTPYRNR